MTPIETLLADVQCGHSALQMDAFITIRAGGTLYGCYFQALRELNTRHQSVIDIEARLKFLDLEMQERSGDSVDPLQNERDRIKNDQAERLRSSNERALAEAIRERDHFHEQADMLRRMLEQRGINFPLDAETKHVLDCEMWEHRLKSMAAVDLIHAGRLERSTIEFLQSIHPGARRRLYSWIFDKDRHQDLINWYLDYEPELHPCLESSGSPRRL